MQELIKIAFPAIIEQDKKDKDFYLVKCPDIEECEIFGLGFYNTILETQSMLDLYLSKEKYKNIKPSTKDEISKKFPNKKIYFITPSKVFKNEQTLSSSHYQVLKIVKSDEVKIDIYGEAVSPFNKIILFLTILKQADILEGYKCNHCKNSLKNQTAKKEELRKQLYSLKEPLIEEYCSIYNLNIKEETEFIDEIINSENQFACCHMFDLIHSNESACCQCGFHNYKSIKNELDQFNCFNNLQEFVKKFLSLEYKFIALSIEHGKSYKDYIFEHNTKKRLEEEFKE